MAAQEVVLTTAALNSYVNELRTKWRRLSNTNNHMNANGEAHNWWNPCIDICRGICVYLTWSLLRQLEPRISHLVLCNVASREALSSGYCIIIVVLSTPSVGCILRLAHSTRWRSKGIRFHYDNDTHAVCPTRSDNARAGDQAIRKNTHYYCRHSCEIRSRMICAVDQCSIILGLSDVF